MIQILLSQDGSNGVTTSMPRQYKVIVINFTFKL